MMTWFRKLRIWWWNFRHMMIIHEMAAGFWKRNTSAENRKIIDRSEALLEARNAYCFKHKLRPHPNAPDNWYATMKEEFVATVEAARKKFLNREVEITNVNGYAGHPFFDRAIKNGDIVLIEKIDLHKGGYIYMGWKCDPALGRSNSMFGKNWNGIKLDCFAKNPVDPPLDWTVGLQDAFNE